MIPAAPVPPVDLLRPAPRADVARDAGPEDIRRVARDFEAAFLSVMLQPVFNQLSTEAPFGGGSGEQAYRSFLTEAMAKQTVRAGGIGLAAAVERELLKMQGLT